MNMHYAFPVAPSVIVGLMIAMGAVLCFFGYRAFRGVLVIVGFVLGFVFCFDAIVEIFHNRYAAFFVALVVGVVLGALSTRVYLVGVFVVAALFGVALALHFYAIGAEKPEPAMLFIFGAVAGIAAIYFQKVAIIVVTALAGAWGMVAGVANFATSLIDPLNLRSIERFAHSDTVLIYIVVASWIVLAAAGIAFQYRRRAVPESTPRRRSDDDPVASSASN